MLDPNKTNREQFIPREDPGDQATAEQVEQISQPEALTEQSGAEQAATTHTEEVLPVSDTPVAAETSGEAATQQAVTSQPHAPLSVQKRLEKMINGDTDALGADALMGEVLDAVQANQETDSALK